MQVNISGQHLELTPNIREYVTSKLDRLERHYDQITNVQVTLSVEKLRQQAEAKLHVTGGEVFANAEHDDLYAAIDALADKLDRQLIKHKEKAKAR
ncbi:ribosome hibernation-promoting factor, HPF/YfiA family [Litoribacillus peritrichatus]|uniref:Ribosome hibernation promoting factor n=1 Tax=Litoribacillus peritrichatus TaxID=718191 RepID=A0ABP7N7T1_9GAMM